MPFARFISIVVLVFCFTGLAQAQSLSDKESCKKFGFKGEQHFKPGLGASMVLRGMPKIVQCGMMFYRDDSGETIRLDSEDAPPEIKELHKEFQKKVKQVDPEQARRSTEYFETLKRNKIKAKSRRENAQFKVSLLIDVSSDSSMLENKIDELVRFSEKKKHTAIGALMVVGMERHIEEWVNGQLLKLYNDNSALPSANKKMSLDERVKLSLKPRHQQTMSDVEILIHSRPFRRKGNANVRSILSELSIDRIPVWIVTENGTETVFDAKEELSGLINNFGELNLAKKLPASAPGKSLLKRVRSREFVYVEDFVQPRTEEFMNYINTGNFKGRAGKKYQVPTGKREGLSTF